MNIPFKQTPNYSVGDGKKKLGFVIHGTLGAYQGAIDWLCNPNRTPLSSAHYVIGRKEGEVIQLVKNEDVSWHAGVVSEPNDRARKVLPKRLDGTYDNPNKYFIGIELAWGYDINGDGLVNAYDKTVTEWQYKCILDIIKSSGISFDTNYLLTHTDIASYKGDNLSDTVQEVIKRLSPGGSTGVSSKGLILSEVEKLKQFISNLN